MRDKACLALLLVCVLHCSNTMENHFFIPYIYFIVLIVSTFEGLKWAIEYICYHIIMYYILLLKALSSEQWQQLGAF